MQIICGNSASGVNWWWEPKNLIRSKCISVKGQILKSADWLGDIDTASSGRNVATLKPVRDEQVFCIYNIHMVYKNVDL